MRDTTTPMPIVLLFIGTIFYVFGYVMVNNEYNFVIFGDINNVQYEHVNEDQNDTWEMLNENDCHGLCPIPIPTHTLSSLTIEFISISARILGNNDLKCELDIIREENSIHNETLSGM